MTAPLSMVLINPRPIVSRRKLWRWLNKLVPPWMQVVLGIVQ